MTLWKGCERASTSRHMQATHMNKLSAASKCAKLPPKSSGCASGSPRPRLPAHCPTCNCGADQPSSASAAGRIAVEDFNDLRKWIQERMQGGCRVFSKGSDCRCPLCLLERVAEGSLPLAADQPSERGGK